MSANKKCDHTEEGKRRHTAKQSASQRRQNKEQKTQEVLNTEGGEDSNATKCKTKNNGKYFTCGKVHFPYCKCVARDKWPCHVCKKIHFPFCKKPAKESHTTEAENTLQVKITGAMVECLIELCVTICMAAGLSDSFRCITMCVNPEGGHAKMTTGPGCISSVTVAMKGLLYDVHKSDLGPISGFTGEVNSFYKAGYLIIPNKTKLGAALQKTYVGQGNLPTRVDDLISECHSTMLGADISMLCHEPKYMKPMDKPYDDRHKDICATHKLIAKVGGTHFCVLVSNVKMSGIYAKHYVAVRYLDGSVVIMPKGAVSELNAEMVTVVTTCCLDGFQKLVEASKCTKHPGFAKLTSSAAHYHEAKKQC